MNRTEIEVVKTLLKEKDFWPKHQRNFIISTLRKYKLTQKNCDYFEEHDSSLPYSIDRKLDILTDLALLSPMEDSLMKIKEDFIENVHKLLEGEVKFESITNPNRVKLRIETSFLDPWLSDQLLDLIKKFREESQILIQRVEIVYILDFST